ncbi:prepilin peptidase [Candidatus Kaiserbacteria bacterium]|nr:prepilin peptidase [Candidatus Kaiserbacteria bacterium]
MFSLFDAGFFALGAVVASFVGVVVARFNTGQSFFLGRSRCDACAASLSLRQLVPIFSFIASRGRARCCGAYLSPLAPLSELLLGVLFVLAYQALGFSYALPLMLTAFSTLLALVLYDLAHRILPFPLLAVFVAISALTGLTLAASPGAFLSTAVTALFLSLFLAGIHVASRGRAMGLADAPFAFGCALLVGSAALPGFIFSFWIGAPIGIVLLLQRPRGSRMGVEVPFAPYLAAGFLLAYFTQWNPFVFVVGLPSTMGIMLGLP